MTLISILAVAGLTVLVSELLGRGRVLYVRLFGLVLSFLAVSVAVLVGLHVWYGLAPEAAVAIVLSTAPVLGAWIGFRIHLSNSITLELLTLLNEKEGRPYHGIVEDYDPKEHISRRIRNLQTAHYLESDGDASLAPGLRPRLMLKLIGFLQPVTLREKGQQ